MLKSFSLPTGIGKQCVRCISIAPLTIEAAEGLEEGRQVKESAETSPRTSGAPR